jgi:D-xylono/L-arabinono-1,4-lactonase
MNVEVLINERCTLGEGPCWDEQSGRLVWTDIDAGRIYECALDDRKCKTIYQGEPVGGFTLQEDGSLLLFRVHDIARLEPDGAVTVVADSLLNANELRFNDVTADPKGRVFAGSFSADSSSAGLYRIDLDGSITRLFGGTGCSNGMGFSDDLTRMWWTCSTRKKIFRFDYDVETGTLSNRMVFLDFAHGGPVPDGLTIDAAGFVWSAFWEGYCIKRFDLDGNEVDKVKLPVAKVTSLAFGGSQYQDIFVTTAGGCDSSSPEAGSVYRIKTPYRGRPEFRSKIGLHRNIAAENQARNRRTAAAR